MRLDDLETVQKLRRALREADDKIKAFEEVGQATVQVRAYSCDERDGFPAIVILPPVDRIVPIRAARSEREQIVNELRSLGVTLD